jgi:hypothetical protein
MKLSSSEAETEIWIYTLREPRGLLRKEDSALSQAWEHPMLGHKQMNFLADFEVSEPATFLQVVAAYRLFRLIASMLIEFDSTHRYP